MIRKILLSFGVFLLLAAGESAVARWLPSPFAVPLLLPALLTLAFWLPVRRLARLAILGGLAGEVTSGLPAGTVLLALVLLPLGARGLVHRRPDLPLFLRGLVGMLATLVFVAVMHVSASSPFLPPSRLLGWFLTADIIFPTLFSGALALLMSAVLVSREQRGAFPRTGTFADGAGAPRFLAR